MYRIDTLKDWQLKPRLACLYPCKDCDGKNQSQCTSCWGGSRNPTYLMKERGSCRKTCDIGYTSNGSADRTCVKCNESCAQCKDDGKVNDKFKCVRCNKEKGFTERRKGSELCFDKPEIECSFPCLTCDRAGKKFKFCTSCRVKSLEKYLLKDKGQCLRLCPKGYKIKDTQCVLDIAVVKK